MSHSQYFLHKFMDMGSLSGTRDYIRDYTKLQEATLVHCEVLRALKKANIERSSYRA